MIRTRPATPEDRLAVQELLGQLGYAFSAEEAESRLIHLAASGNDPVLVATRDDEVVGLIGLQFSTMLHLRDPVARVTALVVRDGGRGGGIGRALIDAGEVLARQAGCSILELTTGVARTQTHVFYRKLGFINSSLRFSRVIPAAVVS
ncbi:MULTISPECIES: GNAT family N-acetyltransferase [Rhodopseudomonas]|uniref:GNAT family N-acetyltransferase n=1 Tax=Rhodopseudomonas TaxID=1073 RepID=UPI0009BBB560|nr:MULTISPECIES: GNAT family N-acetyltransferase [Rhodopseudomonas]MDF3813491.1 GNAT family N-acetyltransferase [Rhodopseudomonas sp. BAL398]WOK18681.1 GNAT family N-acetyltransferase [Rhodopseudomonas sp. BAL398]